MRCPRCGNENPGTNRFCGMCGATLLPAPVPVTQSASTTASRSSAASQAPPPAAPASPSIGTTASRSVHAPEPEPLISGPSFLGLNQPSASSGEPRRGSLSIDPNSAPSSRNLDYLLDDEEPHRGGAAKYFLILIALLLAAGFGYLRWRHQPFPWQISGTHKPSASQTADQTDSNAPSRQASSNGSTSLPPADSATTSPQGATSAGTATSPSNTNPAPGSTPSITPLPDSTEAAANPPPAAAKQPAPTKQASDDADADSDSSSDDAADNPAAAPKPKPATTDAGPKPSATQRSAGTVAEAQRYLYGKGAKQDCDRGLRLLKPAADRADPKAMIEMGALYSAGLCTPRDLPTAYRWFAMALRKEPDNQGVQDDLQKLWGEMTQPERQLAIKLSQ